MKKLCFFTGHYDPARQVIMSYTEKVMPKDVSLFVFCAKKLDEKYKLKRTKIFEFTGSKPKSLLALRKFCKENNIDILTTLTDSPETALAIIYSTIFTKTKSILNFEGSPTFHIKNWSFLFFQFFIDRFLACSEQVSNRVKKFLIFRRNQTFYLPNPINVSIFSPGNMKLARKKLGLSKYKKVIVYIGRLEPTNQSSDCLLELAKNNPSIYFVFVGQILDEKFKNISLKNIKLIPYIENTKIPNYYRAADLSIFLSKRNSYPFPPRESLACQTPVLVLDIEAFKPVPKDIMIKSTLDIKELQNKIDSFFSLSGKEKKNIGKRGRNFIIEDSSEEKVKDKTLKYLLEF